MLFIILLLFEQNAFKWSHKALKSSPIERDCQNEIAGCDNGGSSRLILQQGSLSKVVARTIRVLLAVVIAAFLERFRSALDDHVEVLTLISLGDNSFAILEPLLLEGIGDAATLLQVELLEDFNVLKEVLEAMAPLLHGQLYDAAE